MRNLVYPNAVADHALGQARQPLPARAKTIPFDYVFQFPLRGEPNNRVQDVVDISMEGVFVALSIGYSLVLDEQRLSRTFPPVISQRTIPQNPVLVPLFDANDTLTHFLVAGMPESEVALLELSSSPTPLIRTSGRVEPNGTVEVNVQNLNLSPSTVRVWDRTNNLLSQVFEVRTTPQIFVAGAGPMTSVIGPDPITRRLPSAGDTIFSIYGSLPQAPNVEVFLLPGTSFSPQTPFSALTPGQPFQRESRFGHEVNRAEVTLTSPNRLTHGDVLLVKTVGPPDRFNMLTIPRPRLSTVPLGVLAAGLESIGADLTGGFRLNPNFAGLATADLPLDQLAPGTLNRAFETGCVAAEEVSFRYSIDAVGTGRELQNKEIHNIAGLGIANGDRPFRPFAKPMMFEPRSSIRIQITEISGPPGTLFIVLQGYKMLGTGRIPG
jgi:hypothetical protein